MHHVHNDRAGISREGPTVRRRRAAVGVRFLLAEQSGARADSSQKATFRRRGTCLCAHERAAGHCPHIAVQDITREEQRELLSAVLARVHSAKDEPHTHTSS